SGGIESGKFGDPPVVVAIAERGSDDEALAVGRPLKFVNVGVRRSDLAELARGEIDQREALLEERVLDLTGFRGFRDERARGACGVFGEQNRDGSAVRRPAGG